MQLHSSHQNFAGSTPLGGGRERSDQFLYVYILKYLDVKKYLTILDQSVVDNNQCFE